MDLLTIIFSISTVVIVYFYYFSKQKNYFEEHEIPHIKPWPLLGNMASSFFQKTSMVHYLQKIYDLNKDAKYVGFFDFRTPAIVIRDPELIKLIATKNFDHFVNHRGFVNPNREPLFGHSLFSLRGDRWREIRTLLTPAFTSSKIKGMFKSMSNCAEIFANYIVEKSKKMPLEINSKDTFARYTNDVISTCAFGISINSMKDEKNDFYTLGRKAISFEKISSLKFFFVQSFPLLAKLLGVRIFDPAVNGFFTKMVEDTISIRDKKGITRPDMIQLMMETRTSKNGTALSIADMAAQAFIFYLGGFDTTSSLLCFVVQEIAAHPDIQERLQMEIDDVFEKNNGDVTYEAVNELQYLDAVINETLRYYFAGCGAGFLDRVCTKSFELPPTLPGKKPLLLKPGDIVWFPIFSIQRDSKYFHDADKFYPDRFIEDPKGTLNSSAYAPFGIGPRMCIGNRVALLEVKVMLFHLISKLKFKPAKKMITPLEISTTSIATTAKGGFWLEIEPRNK